MFLLFVGWVIFFSGLLNCCYNRNKNIILFLLFSEVLSLGSILLGVWLSLAHDCYNGFVFSFAVIVCTVAESVLGLSLSIILLKTGEGISIFQIPEFESKLTKVLRNSIFRKLSGGKRIIKKSLNLKK